jgi:hypothetical protein
MPVRGRTVESCRADAMNSALFINLPAVISFSAHSVFPAHLVDLDRTVPASGKGRLAARLSMAAANEFLLYQLRLLHLPLADLLLGKSWSVLDSGISGIRRDQPHASFDLMCVVSVVQL